MKSNNKAYNKIISLLPKRYSKINSTIFCFKNKYKLNLHLFLYKFFHKKDMIDKDCCNNNNNNLAGCFQINNNNIYLFEYRMKFPNNICEEQEKIFKILNLIHEIRHVYQNKYFKAFKKTMKNYKQVGEIGYENQWVEKDANIFAKNFVNLHMKEISKILKFSSNSWRVDKYNGQ